MSGGWTDRKLEWKGGWGGIGREALLLILEEGLMTGTDKESHMTAKYEYMASSCGAQHRFPAINWMEGESDEQLEGCFSGC